MTERLTVTLGFPATVDSYHSTMHLLKVPAQSVSLITPQVCEALVNALDACLKVCFLDQKIKLLSIFRCKYLYYSTFT